MGHGQQVCAIAAPELEHPATLRARGVHPEQPGDRPHMRRVRRCHRRPGVRDLVVACRCPGCGLVHATHSRRYPLAPQINPLDAAGTPARYARRKAGRSASRSRRRCPGRRSTWGGHGATDSLAPYVVGARAAWALAGLGLRVRDALTYLGLVLSGAWTLVDMWQTVKDSEPEKTCTEQWMDNQGRCSRWAKGDKGKHACCMGIAADRMLECKGHPGPGHKLPWEKGYDKAICG